MVNKQQPDCLLFKNTSMVSDFNLCNSADFLRTYPRGVYTACRTLECHSILFYNQHVLRLTKGSTSSNWRELSLADIESKVSDSVKKAMEMFSEYHPNREMRLTILLERHSEENEPLNVYTHIVPFPIKERQPVPVQLRIAHRDFANTKDSSWVIQRKALEDAKPLECNEVMMCDEHGKIFEGLSSNVIAVRRDGSLVTASDGVLFGTIRNEIVDICKEKDIKIHFQPPSLDETWSELMVTSTSRLVLPISKVLIPTADQERLSTALQQDFPAEIRFKEHPVADFLNSEVVSRLRKRSTRILS